MNISMVTNNDIGLKYCLLCKGTLEEIRGEEQECVLCKSKVNKPVRSENPRRIKFAIQISTFARENGNDKPKYCPFCGIGIETGKALNSDCHKTINVGYISL